MTVRFDKIIVYLYIIGIILTTNTLTGCFMGITKIEIVLAVSSIIIAMIYGACINAKKICWLIVYTILLLMIEVIVYPQMLIECLRLPLLVFSFFLFFSIYNKRVDIVKIFFYSSLVLCSLSTGMYFLVEVFKLDIPHTVTNFPWLLDYNSYFMLYFRLSLMETDYLGPLAVNRNCGLFTEPGLYSVFIVLNIYIYIFELKKKNIFCIIVFVISLLTTVSGTGMLGFLLLIMFKVMFDEKCKTTYKIYITRLAVILCTILFAWIVLEFKATNHPNSYSSRMFDFYQAINLFLQKPLFGWGYNNKTAFFSTRSILGGISRTNRICSNGVMIALYQLGLIGTAIYYYPICRYIMCNTEKGSYERKKTLMLCVLLVILVMGEPIQYNSIMLALTAFFMEKTESGKMRRMEWNEPLSYNSMSEGTE